MRFAYQVVINSITEGTFKCVHFVVTETHARMKSVTRVQCSWIFVCFFFQVPYLKRGLKKAIGLTTTVHWHHAFLYVSLPSLNNYDTWKCPFVERANTIRRLSFSFSENRYSLKTNWTKGNHRDKVWSIANTLFKWRFCSCRHRCCLRSLMFPAESVE